MTTKKQEKIKFSKAFWVANTVELFERAAYYGVFIVITLYLSRILGFNDIQAASIAGIFSACLYLLPTFAGALADKIGFRNSMLLAFTLLTCGYLGLAVYPTWLQSAGLVEYSTTTTFTGLLESNLQYGIIPIMALIVCGGAFIKSVISGTVAKETTPETRAKGFSIFYAMVNIGAFSGKTIVKPLREALGNEGLITLNYFSASMTFLALIAIWFFYKSTQHSGEGKTFGQIWNEIKEVEEGKASKEDNVLKNAPHPEYEVTADEWKHAYPRTKAAFPLEWLHDSKFWINVARVDNAYGDRNLIPTLCACEI